MVLNIPNLYILRSLFSQIVYTKYLCNTYSRNFYFGLGSYWKRYEILKISVQEVHWGVTVSFLQIILYYTRTRINTKLITKFFIQQVTLTNSILKVLLLP